MHYFIDKENWEKGSGVVESFPGPKFNTLLAFLVS